MYKIGSKLTALIGVILVSLGTCWTLAVQLNSPYWYFVGLMIVIGFGMGYAMTPTTVLIQSAVGWQMRGAATASNSFVRSLGQTIGITILGSMFNTSVTNYAKAHMPANAGQHAGNISHFLQSSGGGLAKIPPAMRQFMDQALAHAIHQIFMVIFIVAVASLVATLFLPSHQRVMQQQKQVN